MKRDPLAKPREYEDAVIMAAKLIEEVEPPDRAVFSMRLSHLSDLISFIYHVEPLDVVDDITLAMMAMTEGKRMRGHGKAHDLADALGATLGDLPSKKTAGDAA